MTQFSLYESDYSPVLTKHKNQYILDKILICFKRQINPYLSSSCSTLHRLIHKFQ